MSLSILGTGHFLPGAPLHTDFLSAVHDQEAARLRRAPGVLTRHYACGHSQVDMASMAARAALEDADTSLDEIDLVISACAVSYQPIPGLAPRIARELGAEDGRIEALDVNTTCLSFLSALDLAETMIAAGRITTALIVSSEMASRALPWQADPETAALFGDGAAAMVIGPGQTQIRARHFESHPSLWEACQIGAGGTRFNFHTQHDAFAAHAFFEMDGKSLFKVTAKALPRIVETTLIKAGWEREEIDLVIPHQASPMGLAHMTRICRFDATKVVDIVAQYGNMIAASIPFTLDHARRAGRIAPGAKLLILGTSAGVNFGAMALEIAP